MLLKAELHCHIEGAAAPELGHSNRRANIARTGRATFRTAPLSGVTLPASSRPMIFRPTFFRTEEDYALLADHYLTSLARDGCIYSETFTSPDHARKAGLSPQAYTDALGEGMMRAKAKTGIEARMIVTGVRHVGVEAIESAARFAAKCRPPAGHRLRRGRRRADG
jgi:adenosine deaminase